VPKEEMMCTPEPLQTLRSLLRQAWHDEAGLTTVEYALMLMLMVVASVAAWTLLGEATTGSASASAEALPNN